jgi:hypothetical protein
MQAILDTNEDAIDTFRYYLPAQGFLPTFKFPEDEVFPLLKLLAFDWSGLAPNESASQPLPLVSNGIDHSSTDSI